VSDRPHAPPPRGQYLDRDGTLIVLRSLPGAEAPELLLVLADDGGVTAFNGHVDLGTGIRTALAQIVAEELDVPLARVTMVLGDIDAGPDQGPTIASETIQVAAVPLRQAAAQARRFLLERAGQVLGLAPDELLVADGSIGQRANPAAARIAFAALLAGRRERLLLAADAPLKPVAEYRVVGQSVQRVDIPDKAAGTWAYVHDVRLPGMLHGHVVRPPYAGLDSGAFVGTSLLEVDTASIDALPGVVATVVIRDFIGVVAEREEQALAAAQALRVTWKPVPAMPDLHDLASALLAQPSRPRTLRDTGDVDARLAAAERRLPRTYVWPYQMHGSIGPSCAVADYRADGLTVWSGTQNPHTLRKDLALLLGMPAAAIGLVRIGLLRPQRRRRRHRRCRAAVARRRPARARPADARAGAPVGSQGCRPGHGRRWRPGARRLGRGVRLLDALSVQRRPYAGAAAHRHRGAGRRGLRHGRPHGHTAVRFRVDARRRQRPGADRARLLAARRLGAAQQLRARVVCR
jgi:nicotinate dehydrogenase subunit B